MFLELKSGLWVCFLTLLAVYQHHYRAKSQNPYDLTLEFWKYLKVRESTISPTIHCHIPNWRLNERVWTWAGWHSNPAMSTLAATVFCLLPQSREYELAGTASPLLLARHTFRKEARTCAWHIKHRLSFIDIVGRTIISVTRMGCSLLCNACFGMIHCLEWKPGFPSPAKPINSYYVSSEFSSLSLSLRLFVYKLLHKRCPM